MNNEEKDLLKAVFFRSAPLVILSGVAIYAIESIMTLYFTSPYIGFFFAGILLIICRQIHKRYYSPAWKKLAEKSQEEREKKKTSDKK